MIANLITASRITGAMLLWFIEPFSALFYTTYLACGISDVLDGHIARKTNTVSKFGSALDSIADFILTLVMLLIFIPILAWERWMVCWIIGIAMVRFISMGVGFWKYRSLPLLHTYANKATGIALFCFPLFYHIVGLTATAILLCSIASLSSLEELTISIRLKKLNRDIRSLFTK
ncbi:MAG: CDP-alcohol phosphatidyltransferase family protein [Defluviitaleaceae bacterium]|nr:CDP-alcohol phosphatidyltransferase family protein [Defluviitaleaceae bacterium]